MKVHVCPEVLVALKDLEATVTAIGDHELEDADAILIRVEGDLWIHLMRGGLSDPTEIERAGSATYERVPQTKLFLAPSLSWLAAQAQGNVLVDLLMPRQFDLSSTPPRICELPEKDALDALRRGCLAVEVSEGLRRCTVTAPSTHHFKLPSDAHATHFIRLSEAFTSIQSVDSVAYWVSTSLAEGSEPTIQPPRVALLVDHPSMLMLGVRIQRLLNTDAPVECLPGYPVDLPTRSDAQRVIEQLANDGIPVACIVGVASTGKLKRTLEGLSSSLQPPLKTIIVFSSQQLDGFSTLGTLDVPGYKHFAPGTACELCDSGKSHVIQIQSTSFLIAIDQPKLLALPPPNFEQQKNFISTWGRVEGALRIHFDDPNEEVPRHHAYGVNAVALLNNRDFRDLTIARLRALSPRPQLALVPGHRAEQLLREIVQEALEIEVISDRDLRPDNTVLHHRFKNPVVLVFDDKAVTGGRLKSMNDILRREGAKMWGDFSYVHFYCPIATPESVSSLKKIERGLTTRHPWNAALITDYVLPLPPWHTPEECPWCIEASRLELLANVTDVMDTPLTQRLSNLRYGTGNAPCECFPPSLSGEEHSVLGNGSLAAEPGATHVQVAFACAVAVQRLRTQDRDPLNSQGFPTPTQLERAVLSDNYSEGLLRCGILRALTPTEISGELSEFVTNLFLHPHSEAAMTKYHAELIGAFLANKLGQPPELLEALSEVARYGISAKALTLLGYGENGKRLVSD